MTKYNVKYVRDAVDGYDEQVFDVPVEALDPQAAALVAGVLIFVDTLKTTSLGAMLEMVGLDVSELGDITADSFKDCVHVSVTSV